MNEIIPSRVLNPLHIIFDVVFLLIFVVMLIKKKLYMTLLFGIAGGIIYFIVDWGIFYKIMGTREIFLNGANMSESGKLLFLFWLSMTYGITNFCWIWLWLKKDENLKEFSLYILIGWLAVAVAATGLGSNFSQITIRRGTDKFHAFMAIFMAVAYGSVILYNLLNRKGKKLPLFRMLAIGILVQLGWETALLLGGVRSAGYSAYDTVSTLIVNSLIETSPAAPVIFGLQILIYKWRGEDLKPARKIPVSGDLQTEAAATAIIEE